LKDAAPGKASYIRPFNLHPAFNSENAEFPARQQYYVPVKELHEQNQEALDPKSISVPYRSTLKKFEVEWIGKPPGLSGGIDGEVKLANDIPFVNGDLFNNTGHDLRMVYFVVEYPLASEVLNNGKTEEVSEDLVLYVSFWPKGGKVSLTRQFGRLVDGGASHVTARDKSGDYVKLSDPLNPNNPVIFQGRIQHDTRLPSDNWMDVWYDRSGFRNTQGYVDNREYSEKDPLSPNSFPILSFFDRLPVSRNKLKSNYKMEIESNDRANFLRRGVREYDISNAISGGSMAIIAVSATREEELPFPLEVQGDLIKGKGVIYYQFVVPVDRSAVNKAPTSQPATKPATQRTKGKDE
jgi:hypothetical protein